MESAEQSEVQSSPLARQLWWRHVLAAGVIPKQQPLAMTHGRWLSLGKRVPLLGDVQRRWRVSPSALPTEALPVAQVPVRDFQGYVSETHADVPRQFAVPRHEAAHIPPAHNMNHPERASVPFEPLVSPQSRIDKVQREPFSSPFTRTHDTLTRSEVKDAGAATPVRATTEPASPQTSASPLTVVVGTGIRQRTLVTRAEPVIQRKAASPSVHVPQTDTALPLTLSPAPVLSHPRGASPSPIPALPVHPQQEQRPSPMPTPILTPLPSPQRERETGRMAVSTPSRMEREHAMPLAPASVSPSLTRVITIPEHSHGPEAVTIRLARPFRRVVRDEQTMASPLVAQVPRAVSSEHASLSTPVGSLFASVLTLPISLASPARENGTGTTNMQLLSMTRSESAFHPIPMPVPTHLPSVPSPPVVSVNARNEHTPASPTSRTTTPDTARPLVKEGELPTLAASSPDPQVDVGQLAEQVYSVLVQRLTREKQRRGW